MALKQTLDVTVDLGYGGAVCIVMSFNVSYD